LRKPSSNPRSESLACQHIVVEVEKQLGSLKPRPPKRDAIPKSRPDARDRPSNAAGKARELDAEAERFAKQLEELTASELQRATAIQQQEASRTAEQRIYELDAEMRQNQNVLNLTRSKPIAARTASHSTANAPRSLPGATSAPRRAGAGHGAGRGVRVPYRLANSGSDTTARRIRQDRRTRGRTASCAESRASQITAAKRASKLCVALLQSRESLLRLHGEQKQAEEALVHQAEALRKLEATSTMSRNLDAHAR